MSNVLQRALLASDFGAKGENETEEIRGFGLCLVDQIIVNGRPLGEKIREKYRVSQPMFPPQRISIIDFEKVME